MKNLRWILIVIIAILITTVAVFCLKPVSVDCGTSELYTEDEIQYAAEIVKLKFTEFGGCRLISLKYSGDDNSLREAKGRDYDDIVVIKSVFLSPLKAKSAWEPHSVYNWDFILGRKSEEKWEILDYGEA